MAQHKLYGNSLHFFEGRFISGPDARSCIASVLMILVPSILWHVSVGAFFARSYSPIFSIFGVLLQLAALVLLISTAFTDPGIMPRSKEYTEHYDPHSKSYRQKPPNRYYDLHLRGHPFKLKWCTTCNIYRPPRCTHCAVCENCIERFDHHCPWIGNCVGKRNYWLFYSFVSTTGLLNVYVLATSMAQMGVLISDFTTDRGITGGQAFVDAMTQEPLTTALVLYCAGIVWFVVGLCMYHSYLISTNQTTYEQIKGAYTSRTNPFNRGIYGNFCDVLLSPTRPRYFNPYTGRLLWPSSASTDVGTTSQSMSLAPAAGAESDQELHTDALVESTGNVSAQ